MNNSSSTAADRLQINPNAAGSLHAFLTQSIDYAGLFPPAELTLETALKNHAAYVRSSDVWMLNSFVLPVTKFGEAASYFSMFDRQHPLRISALAGKSGSRSEFERTITATAAAIRDLQSRQNDGVSVVQLEIALPTDSDLDLLGALCSATNELGLRIFCEAPPANAEKTIALLAQEDTSKSAPLGYKLRTGGVTADAFPTSEEIARALVAAGRDHVPIKFTAGLHHPIRQFRDEVKTKMHGFLNVMGAGLLTAEHGWDMATAATMLDDEDPNAFVFDHNNFAWREWKIATDAVREHRGFVTSFGSCSFDEPRDDLRALKLL
jgi:hypothetical protein